MKKILLLTLASVLIFSCRNENNPSVQEKIETPKALQENKIDISSISKRYGNNLVDELYEGLLEGRSDLKEIEALIDKNNSTREDLLDQHQNFSDKNDQYYSSAHNQVAAIKDSLLKAKIILVLKESMDDYKQKTSHLNALVQSVARKYNSINDYYIALKVVSTLPLIEKFQESDQPKPGEYKTLIMQQDSLLHKMDKLVK